MDKHAAPIDAEIETALTETERAGLRLTLIVRSALVVAFAIFSIVAQPWPQGLTGAGYASIFLVSGLVYLALVQAKRDARWMRFGFVALDVGMIAFVATQVPLSMNGDVPQIFVFRVYGAGVFFFILASSALSLSPSLVLWTGATVVAAMWGAWVWIVSGMERRVSWDDLPQGSNAEQYMAIVLDPDFTGIGNRVIETLLLLATSFVTAEDRPRTPDAP
ncbi:MAG: hypothetical protein AAGF90_08135, partial [Pseudomonadota bacterium]